MSYAFGAEASVSIGTGGARASVSSGSGSRPKGLSASASNKALTAEWAKKAAAEEAAAFASDIGARFFAGETDQYIPARQAINQTIALYNQTRDLALSAGISVLGPDGPVTAAERATDYDDRVEELDVAAAEMVKQFISRLQLKIVPRPAPAKQLPILKLAYFGKSTAIKPTLIMARLGQVPKSGAPAPGAPGEEPIPWLWIGLGAAALGVGALFVFK